MSHIAVPPAIKRLLPKWARRFLLLNVLHVNRRYAGLLRAASRLCMQNEILPWVRARYASVLFVGAAPYTYHYEELFRQNQYTTIDINPATAVWGAHCHLIAPVQDINRHRPAGYFDCVILNGVFGFGVDKIEDMRAVLEELYKAMPPGALLIVGWNTNLHADPETIGLYAGRFVRCDEAPWTERRYFPPETHVYDFYKRCSERVPFVVVSAGTASL